MGPAWGDLPERRLGPVYPQRRAEVRFCSGRVVSEDNLESARDYYANGAATAVPKTIGMPPAQG